MKKIQYVLVLVLILAFISPVQGQLRREMRSQETLNWRHVGPQGNRISAVVCDSNDLNVYYAGACAGGGWKSTDGGTNWDPVFDKQSSQSIGSLAIAPSDSNQVWVGTGEPFIRSNVLIGDGIYKSTDAGKTWTRIDAGIPRSVLSYTSAIKEDPVRKGLLYAGTANAVYVSYDDGASWESLQANLPHACITWIAFQEHFNALVVSTNGRGIWIMDDVTPLQQMTPEVKQSNAHLLKPRPAYRFKARQRVVMPPNDQSRIRRAPYGASINYYLKDDPGHLVQIEIFDESGRKIRSLRGSADEGLNRVWRDLRHEPLKQIELRTTPDFHPHVWEEKRFNGHDTRPVPHWGIGAPQAGVLAAQGIYTVKLTAGGKEYIRELEVRKDPNSHGTKEDIKVMVQLWEDTVQHINEVVTMISRLEWMDKQMEEMKLYSKLQWFSGEIGTGPGDIRNTQDYGPTEQQLEVYDLLSQRLDTVRQEYEQLINETISAFNRTLQAAGHGAIITKMKLRSQKKKINKK